MQAWGNMRAAATRPPPRLVYYMFDYACLCVCVSHLYMCLHVRFLYWPPQAQPPQHLPGGQDAGSAHAVQSAAAAAATRAQGLRRTLFPCVTGLPSTAGALKHAKYTRIYSENDCIIGHRVAARRGRRNRRACRHRGSPFCTLRRLTLRYAAMYGAVHWRFLLAVAGIAEVFSACCVDSHCLTLPW